MKYLINLDIKITIFLLLFITKCIISIAYKFVLLTILFGLTFVN